MSIVSRVANACVLDVLEEDETIQVGWNPFDESVSLQLLLSS